MSCMQLSFQVGCPLGLRSRSSGVVKVLFGCGSKTVCTYIYIYTMISW